MITFEDIQRANKTIETVDIKGKDYAEVNQRIKAFRMLYPQGFICTDIISHEKHADMNAVCIIKATVGYINDENGERCILGTGIAYETEGSSFINKTSYIENCETSAVGRALGMCGFGIDCAIASAEETQNAQIQLEAISPITAEQRKALSKMLQEENIPAEYVCDLYCVEQIKDLNGEKFVNLMSNWDKFKKKYAERNNG